MALLKKNSKDIPKDAIILTEEEALKYELKILNNWKTLKDVFAIKYGSTMLGFASIFVGSYVNSYYRKKFKLLSYGKFSSYLPIAFVPAMGSFAIHTQFVAKEIVLNNSCPVCLEVRAAAAQVATGCILPVVLGQLSSLSLATRYGTYNVPFLTQEPRKVLEVVIKQTKSLKSVLYMFIIVQALFASAVTYFEHKSIETVNNKLMQLEYDLESSNLLKE